jgi:hypothetical protein
MNLAKFSSFWGEMGKISLSKKAIAFSIFSVSIFPIAPVQATTVSLTTAFGNGADTWIEKNIPDTNLGSAGVVAIKNDDFTPFNVLFRKIYLRFDLSSTNKSQIGNGDLNLAFVDTNFSPTLSTYSVYGLNDGNVGENWSESTITWNNAPANRERNFIDTSQTTFLGTFSFSPCCTPFGNIVSFSDPRLVSFLQNDNNNLATLIIVRDQVGADTQTFASKENTQLTPPTLQLEITSSPPVSSVPEPSSILGILSLGVLGIGAIVKGKS